MTTKEDRPGDRSDRLPLLPNQLPDDRKSTALDPVDQALTAVGIGIDIRDVLRRLEVLRDGAA